MLIFKRSMVSVNLLPNELAYKGQIPGVKKQAGDPRAWCTQA